jgi:hypothetical protein
LIVAALRIVDAIGLAAIGLGYRDFPVAGMPILATNPDLTRGADVVLAIATIVGVVGLLLLRRWGWTLTLLLVGLELTAHLVRFEIGVGDSVGLALLVVTAFYLNQRSVRILAKGYLRESSSVEQ